VSQIGFTFSRDEKLSRDTDFRKNLKISRYNFPAGGDIGMKMKDLELLRQFSESGSESAFTELLKLHLPLVYGVAIRQTRGDGSLAEEIAQQTFCTLARKAGDISRETILGAWLCRTTFYIAQKAMRGEQRRRVREQRAVHMQSSVTNTGNENIWDELSPHIDEVINLLPEKERNAIVLRFFDQKPMRELATQLGISEEAARMRLSRALEKLRSLFVKRGITITSIAIATLLSEQSRASIPSTLIERMRWEMKRLDNRSKRSPLKARSGMAHYLKLATLSLIVAGLGIVIISVSIPQPKLVSNGSLVKRPVERTQNGQATVRFNLDEAAEALRKALRDPWPSRYPPYQRVDEALARYGRSRRLALPVLMEMFAGLRSTHTANSMKLGAHGLIVLGADASETLRDMLVLYDAGDLRMLDEGVVDLFAAIDPDSSTIPTFFERLRISARQEGIELSMLTDSIVATLIENNPVIETDYRGKLFELLQGNNAESRAHSALILARLRSASEPAIFTNIITVLNSPESIDNDSWRPESFRYAENKQWRLAAIESLRQLRDPASIVPLTEISHAQPVDNEVRTAAFRAIAEINPASQTDSPEIKAAISAQKHGIALAFKAQSGKASHDELVEGLKYRESVGDAAWALGHNQNQNSLPLSAILDAVENFKDKMQFISFGKSDPKR
jgi:RNA polymerase sigma factor (sigma-70 family)